MSEVINFIQLLVFLTYGFESIMKLSITPCFTCGG